MGAFNAGLPGQAQQGSGGGFTRQFLTVSQGLFLPTGAVELHALIQAGGSGSNAGLVASAAANSSGAAGGVVWVRFDLSTLPFRQVDAVVGAAGAAVAYGGTSQGGSSSVALASALIVASGGSLVGSITTAGGFMTSAGAYVAGGLQSQAAIPQGVALLGLGRYLASGSLFEAAGRLVNMTGTAGLAGSGGSGAWGNSNGNGLAGGNGPLSTYSATEQAAIIAALQRIFGLSAALTSGGAGSSGGSSAPGGSGGGASLFGAGGAGGAGNPAGNATAGSTPTATAYGAGAGSGGTGSTGAGAGAAGIQGCIYLAWR